MKILVIDDEICVCNMMTDVLESENHEVITAEDGVEGFERAILEKPDFILTDLEMPGCNGLELFDRLRECGVPTPMVLMTGNHQLAEKVTQAFERIILKPFSIIDVLEAVAPKPAPAGID